MIAHARSGTRPFEEVRALLVERARAGRNPFTQTRPDEAVAALNALTSTEHKAWVAAFGRLASEHEHRASLARRNGDPSDELMLAYGYARVARYPAPTSPVKRAAYSLSQRLYLEAMARRRPGIERVAIPFHGRRGEGRAISAHLRVPVHTSLGDARCPVLVTWGGIDSFKEERRTEPYLDAGFATVAIDMPGTGDAPIVGSVDAERMWDGILDWIGGRGDLDERRVGLLGSSTGGYWAAKLARTHRERIRAAVDHGGPVHHAFSHEWIAKAQVGEYPFDLAETLAAAFGGSSYDDWIRIAPTLSLVEQGVLDRPSAPLLVIHGRHDTVFPLSDAQLLVEHGAEGALLPGGHMGGGDAAARILGWLTPHLAP